jgi:hypothetical protein
MREASDWFSNYRNWFSQLGVGVLVYTLPVSSNANYKYFFFCELLFPTSFVEHH